MAFLALKNHVGGKIGNKGPVASIVASVYVKKVSDSVVDKIERYKEAKKLFDNDESNWDKQLQKAAADLKSRPRKARKSKKSKAQDSE